MSQTRQTSPGGYLCNQESQTAVLKNIVRKIVSSVGWIAVQTEKMFIGYIIGLS